MPSPYRARARAALALSLLAFAAVPSVASAAGPDAAQVRVASDEFDAGARSFKEKDFPSAASHFEAADDAAPSAKALRLAIRARIEAGQPSRAATLAALALTRYPSDAETKTLAEEVIKKNAGTLHELEVSCITPCILAVGTRAIHGEATTRWTVYLDPGKTRVSASFGGKLGSAEGSLEAVVGGRTVMRLEPAQAAPAKPDTTDTPPPKKAPLESPPEDGASVTTEGSGLPPWVFIVGAVATVGAGGATVWSGLDTQNNPGVDAVREACAGQGSDCPEYQDGVSRQDRTNLLIAASAGLGAATLVIGAFFTNWDGDGGSSGTGQGPLSTAVLPAAIVTADGAALVASGRF
jgi:hypothetical protein